MNHALLYLWFALLKRRIRYWLRSLRRPATLIGFLYLAALATVAFLYRREEAVGLVLQGGTLGFAALTMVCGSLVAGFWRRGLEFDPPDLEFLFTSPFTQRQIVFYRLFSRYLFAVVQSLVFYILLNSHFKHPLLAAVCLGLFQIACFHLATAAAIYAGTIAPETHQRVRWMMIGGSLCLVAIYFRGVWGLRLAPAVLSAAPAQLLFYPAVTLPDIAAAPSIRSGVTRLLSLLSNSPWEYWSSFFYLVGSLTAAFVSLWLLLSVKGGVFEPALATTARRAEKRLRIRQGREVAPALIAGLRSSRLPRLQLFRGLGAIVWKNLVAARRSKQALLMVGAFVFIYSAFITGLLHLFHSLSKDRAGSGLYEIQSFDLGVALFLASLTLFLQRAAPFDFRLDGHHLLTFRTLPVTPLGLAVAEVSVPTAFCLLCQAPALLVLFWYARFPALLLVLVMAAFPAVALGLNSVWNLHYLLAAAKRAGGQSGSPTAVGAILVVCLSFLAFFPATWVGTHLAARVPGLPGLELSIAAGLIIQYSVNALLILLLASLFARFEIARSGA